MTLEDMLMRGPENINNHGFYLTLAKELQRRGYLNNFIFDTDKFNVLFGKQFPETPELTQFLVLESESILLESSPKKVVEFTYVNRNTIPKYIDYSHLVDDLHNYGKSITFWELSVEDAYEGHDTIKVIEHSNYFELKVKYVAVSPSRNSPQNYGSLSVRTSRFLFDKPYFMENIEQIAKFFQYYMDCERSWKESPPFHLKFRSLSDLEAL